MSEPLVKKSVKSAVRLSFPPFSWGKGVPLIGQAVNTIIPAILPWAAWPIRGPVVPHEKLAGNTLSALFHTQNIFDKVLIMLTSLPPLEILTKIMKF